MSAFLWSMAASSGVFAAGIMINSGDYVWAALATVGSVACCIIILRDLR